jgi:hypothetical protein
MKTKHNTTDQWNWVSSLKSQTRLTNPKPN